MLRFENLLKMTPKKSVCVCVCVCVCVSFNGEQMLV